MLNRDNPLIIFSKRFSLTIGVILGVVFGLAVIVPWQAHAADVGQARFGDDYASFQIGGADWHPCERECTKDVSCKSWTYITALGQCRLKHSVPDARANACCVSGVKQETAAIAPTADETECARFANEAVDSNAQNQRSSCGLTGPVWSSSYDDVYSHCLDSSPGRRHREADDRQQALQACKQSAEISTKLVCDHYARMAVAENQTNRQYHCGFDGPQWSGDAEQHTRFCQGADRSKVNDQFAAREQQIVECLARGGAADDADCKDFAAKSVDQFGQAQKRRCGDGFSGAGWSGDGGEHYRWCRQHNQGERDAALQNRQQALDGCDQIEIDLGKIFKFKF